MITRLFRAASVLHPRILHAALAKVDKINDSARELRAQVQNLQVRTEQLETIIQMDWEMRDEVQALGVRLDTNRIAAHVAQAVAAAKLVADPFPHVVVEDWLPDDTYQAMMRGLPPAVFFADREERRQRLLVPFRMAPIYSRLVWNFISDEIVGRSLRDALLLKFEEVLADCVASICPGVPLSDLTLLSSDGRIMLRRPGYVITPHRDPRWGFITGLVYLARPGDSQTYGTQLYRVADDTEAPNDKPYYVDEGRCELVKSVPFKANSLLAFLNSTGAHGASIPADAQPATMERYLYQFRLGPDLPSIKALMSQMPDTDRKRWAGAKNSRAS